MTALVTDRLHRLASTLGELKVRLRAALASELGRVVGAAVRDVLVVTLTQRLIAPDRPVYSARWPDDEEERWGESQTTRDPWEDDDTYGVEGRPTPRSDRNESQPTPTVPACTAVAVGVHVGRWWLARRGGLLGAVATGVLIATLGLAGGPVARATLAVAAAAADVLTAGSALDATPHELP